MSKAIGFALCKPARVVAIILIIIMGISPLWANPEVPGWLLINSNAPARYDHKCAYDIDRNMVVLFGGLDSLQEMPSDVWEFSESRSWTRIQASGPEGRAGHGLCYDSASQVTILFGGRNQSGQYLNDTWSWDGSIWTKIDSTGLSPRAFFVMVYDSQRQRIVLFGGAVIDTVYNETWEWDGSQWLLRATDGPPSRVAADMAYDDSYDYPNIPTGECILFGGQTDFDGTALNDSWAWDGELWSELNTSYRPSPREGHALAAEYEGGPVDLFGGRNAGSPDTVYDTTWTLYIGPGSPSWYPAFAVNEPPVRYLADMVSYNRLYPTLLIGGTDGIRLFHDVWAFPVYYGHYVVGDVNGNLIFNGMDVVYAVDFFKGGPPPPFSYDCPPHGVLYVAGDVNASCSFNGLDITYMVAYFKGGPYCHPCPDCPP
jgi:hypothetical protein